MSFTEYLKKNREAFLDRAADVRCWESRLFSGTTYSLWRASVKPMRQSCIGLVLDAGCGRGSWRGMIQETAAGYESIDIARRGNASPTWIGDITAMSQVPDARYDAIVCHQVLEHVRRPWLALNEFYRVLKPGGIVLVSVPHLNRRHELPHDYFRFTQEGLSVLLEDAAFVGVEVQPFGGVFAFLHHQLSFFFPGLFTGVPLLGKMSSAINAPVSWLTVMLDQIIDRPRLMPAGVLAVATKPAS